MYGASRDFYRNKIVLPLGTAALPLLGFEVRIKCEAS